MNQAKLFGKYFIFILGFIGVSLMLKPWQLFFEDEVYKNIFKSMIYDGDFNIVNQITGSQLWLVTKTYFYPLNHPEIQSPFLLPGFLIEWFSQIVTRSKVTEDFEFQLATIALNLTVLSSFWWLTKKICNELKIKCFESDFIVLFFGSTLFFFGLLQSTVVEVFALPFAAFLILNIIQIKNRNFNFSYFISGTCVGTLLILKMTYFPLVAAISLLLLLNFKKLKPRQIVSFVVPVAILLICHMINRYLITGEMFNRKPFYFIVSYWDFSLEIFFSNLLHGFLYYGGLFFSVPLYLVSIVGLFYLSKKLKKENYLNNFEITWIFGWIALILFHQTPLPGFATEEHLQGRIDLCLLPVLALGFVYLKNHLLSGFKKTVIFAEVALVFWNLLITFSYMCVAKINPYLYHAKIFDETDLMKRGFERYLLEFHYNYLKMAPFYKEILVFSFLTAGFVFAIKHFKKRELALSAAVVFALVSFVVMTGSNASISPANIAEMKKNNKFENLVVGDGIEIYFLDFIVDYLNRIRALHDPVVDAKARAVAHGITEIIKTQVIQSTPAFDKAMQNETFNDADYLNVHLNEK